MKAADIRKLSAEEIRTKMDEARHELMNYRFQQVSGQLTDFTRIRSLRRDIARMETILNQLGRAAAVEGEA
ncbi:MAG: 50S ribosomal protein L29 [Chloroflexota bacterium]|jgi:large subunit ribosomal protein L29